jgi:uncharacterized protein
MEAAPPKLNRAFKSLADYRTVGDYVLLPINFTPLVDGSREHYVVTNMAGDYVVVSREDLRQLIDGTLPRTSATYVLLREKHVLYDDLTQSTPTLVTAKYKTSHCWLSQFHRAFHVRGHPALQSCMSLLPGLTGQRRSQCV